MLNYDFPIFLFQGAGQPDRHSPQQQGGRASGISGFQPARARLWRQGGQSRDEHRRKYLLQNQVSGVRASRSVPTKAFRSDTGKLFLLVTIPSL